VSPAGVHHFFVPPADLRDGTVVIKGAEAHHAARVLRVRAGEAISVADGTGRVVEAVVREVGETVVADVTGATVVERPVPALTLCQAVPKGDRMDGVVAKAVEIGVARVVPFLAERSIVRWDATKRRRARERWAALARSAAKQARSPHLTEIDEVVEGLPTGMGGTVVALHEGASTRLREALPAEPPVALTVVVGPEGGLTPAEVDRLRADGSALVTLGGRILRSDTAGLVAATIVGHTYGTLG
jgi:16S rRNA (uracil1498-N3)-methyltransferase